jgi:hypothetical protein
MASFIYLYSKFTEEFLLLSSAGIFALLAIYCYHWVVKKRRLGAARNQVPAGMVKVYLNQLINEAQFVRTQLFGLIGGNPNNADSNTAFKLTHSLAPTSSDQEKPVESTIDLSSGAIPSDLLERLKALESQLSEKESMVVNVNIEKTKLLEEIENLKQNKIASESAAVSNDNSELLNKMKALEERLEEYALFEDDLANLKRLQQENTNLKKRLGEPDQGLSGIENMNLDEKSVETPTAEAAPKLESVKSEPAPKLESVKSEPAPKLESVKSEPAPESGKEAAGALDQAAIDALLDGKTPTPVDRVEESTAKEQVVQIQAKADSAEGTPSLEKSKTSDASKKSPDDFEKLVDSVEDSLTQNAAKPASNSLAKSESLEAKASNPSATNAEASEEGKSQTKVVDPAGAKSDEELLKEFESLLNS